MRADTSRLDTPKSTGGASSVRRAHERVAGRDKEGHALSLSVSVRASIMQFSGLTSRWQKPWA